jgi:hypothetical protein
MFQNLGYKTLDDFYILSTDYIRQSGAKALLDYYFEGSLSFALQSVYPNYNWLLWRFEENVSKGFWDSKHNQLLFMEWLGKKLDIKHLDDWYSKQRQDIENNGGSTFLYKCGNSILNLLQTVYPDHNWIWYKFKNVPKGYWNKLEKQREFMDCLALKC